jgi:D-hexose-6-phosphate mutarotase
MSQKKILIQSDQGKVVFSRHGGQILSWQTVDEQEQLYVSPSAVMHGQAAIGVVGAQ